MLDKVRPIVVESIIAQAVALALAYWFMVMWAIELVSPVDKIALFWPPNAIVAAALIFSSRKHWPLYLIAMALAFFAARVPGGPFPLYVYFGFCAANIIEVLIVAETVKRFVRAPVTHQTLTRVLPVVILASIPATVVSALIGGVFITSAFEKATFIKASVGWLTGDLSGLLLVLPVLLAWLAPGAPLVQSYTKGEIIERTAVTAIIVAIGVLTFAILAEESHIGLVFPYLVFPILIWTAMRLGIRSTTTATLAVGLFAIWLTYLGHGPFSIEGLSGFVQVMGMKIGLITIISTTVFLAVIVADRKYARETLRESEGLFRAVVNNSPTKIHIKDMDGRYTLINKEAQKLYGVTEDEGLGKTSSDLFTKEEFTAFQAHDKAVIETGQASEEEEEFTLDDGVHTYLTVKFPIFDRDEIIGTGAIGTDITDHKRAQNLLREGESIRQSEERLRKIFETSPAGISIVSLETNKRLYLNPAMTKLFGASSVEQLMECDLRTTFVNPEDLDWLRSKTGDDFIEEAEIERVLLDGTRWWCLVHRRLIEYEGQDALIAWHYDISERKRAEEEIKKLNEGLEQRVEERTRELSDEVAERKKAVEARERLAQAVENVPVGILLFDSDDRLVFFNKCYGEMMEVMADILKPGVTFEEIVRTIVERQPNKDAQGREEEFIRERLEQHRNPIGPIDIRREDMWLMANETHLPDGSIFTIITDITERKKAEEDRRLALIDAEQANQAKSEFLATMSHEFRTPLNAILGFSDILSHQYFGPPGEGKYREYAEDIHASGEHLLELVNDLLDISTIEAGKQSLNKEMLAVDEMIAESFNALGQRAKEKRIKLVTEASENLPPLYADRRAIRQILLNLLSNAVKFTPEGGIITASAKASKQKFFFKIVDTGQGISAEKLPNLTEPFIRGEQDPHKAVDGWGLGLAISKSLVDLHDGTLGIKSRVGKGTTVTVTLPNGAP